jgi:hypothetical protein
VFNKLKASVSSSPLAHVVIAAFIGGALPILEPILQNGAGLNFPTVKVALYAGVAAALRAVVLLVPAK